jgi:drug/metabolite transporter (DMT)-like permease
MGVLFALAALLCWGLGDFLIQKNVRKFGDAVVLFFVTAFGAIAIFPFIYSELGTVFGIVGNWWLLMLLSVVILIAGLLDFEALRIGKISVIEPVFALEVPITALLAAIIIKEYLNFWQVFFIILLFLGIFLVAVKSFSFFKNFKKLKWERGVWQAILATLGMGGVNLLFAVGARETSPMMVNWVTSVFMAIFMLIYLLSKGRWGEIVRDWKKRKGLILSVGLVDNLAWIFFAFSVMYIPIAIAIGISESYIALAAALGFILNKEKIKTHQWAGLCLVVVAVVALGVITE